ncbi:putative DNA-binding transcriptional regulator [Streptomyces sp. ADI98-12]|uniref:TetR family transcriptional regulator n=1 Tax=Streptomyces griseus TaxID=1911 RepID=A0A380PD81_STRGR|nr:putative DNA-binding transcriptional regulator [Streptomyces sp. ADI98-12]SUP62492.1 TetR family transcriptional regulator [Streptomyces griseus]
MSGVTQVDASTRQRLLTAAKQLFLEKGADQVSLRAVNAEAGLNPGAVHYHFGSREGLVSALLEQELGPVWNARWADEHGRTTGEPEIRRLVAGLVEPFADLVTTRDGRVMCHLLARTALPSGQLPNAPTAFTPAPFEVRVGRALPELAPQEVSERCALAFTLVMETYGRPMAKGPAENVSFPATATVITFILAGLTAPPGRPDGA